MEGDLIESIKNYLLKRLNSSIQILELRSLSGGACQDNYSCDFVVESGADRGIYKTVLRRDKGGSLMSSLSRVEEYHVSRLAYDNGVLTPRSFWLEESSSDLGSPFYFMDRIPGKANGRYLVKDNELKDLRKNLSNQLADQLTRIHSIVPDKAPVHIQEILWKNGSNEGRSNDIGKFAVNSLREELSKRDEGYPAMELILNWLEKNSYPTEDPVLVHGDFRTGNFMVTPENLTGILDWEFAHWGDFHEDLTWLCMRDWRFGKVKLEAGGLTTRKKFYEDYERISGRNIDFKKVTYWEVMGNIRWAIGCIGQAERHLSGRDRGIELASIGRRACEMEWEAMRLIENAR